MLLRVELLARNNFFICKKNLIFLLKFLIDFLIDNLCCLRYYIDATNHFLEQQRLFELCKNYQALTRREKQIFEMAINGLQNKQIASELGITEITVKVHRRRVMDKMQVRTLADLVHAAGTLQIGKSRCPPRKLY